MKKVFICMCFLAMPMYGVTLAKVKIFLSAFLQMSEMWSSKVNFWWSIDDSNKICTYNSYSVSLLPISNPSTFKITLPFIPICGLLFKTLFLNHSNKPLDACSRYEIRSSTRYRCIAIRITENIDAIYSKKQIN